MIAYCYADGESVVLGLRDAHSMRIERVAEFQAADGAKAKRFALAWNACLGLSDKSLEVIVQGSSSGTLAERALAWSLFVAAARPMARRYLERAQEAIKKQGEA